MQDSPDASTLDSEVERTAPVSKADSETSRAPMRIRIAVEHPDVQSNAGAEAAGSREFQLPPFVIPKRVDNESILDKFQAETLEAEAVSSTADNAESLPQTFAPATPPVTATDEEGQEISSIASPATLADGQTHPATNASSPAPAASIIQTASPTTLADGQTNPATTASSPAPAASIIQTASPTTLADEQTNPATQASSPGPAAPITPNASPTTVANGQTNPATQASSPTPAASIIPTASPTAVADEQINPSIQASPAAPITPNASPTTVADEQTNPATQASSPAPAAPITPTTSPTTVADGQTNPSTQSSPAAPAAPITPNASPTTVADGQTNPATQASSPAEEPTGVGIPSALPQEASPSQVEAQPSADTIDFTSGQENVEESHVFLLQDSPPEEAAPGEASSAVPSSDPASSLPPFERAVGVLRATEPAAPVDPPKPQKGLHVSLKMPHFQPPHIALPAKLPRIPIPAFIITLVERIPEKLRLLVLGIFGALIAGIVVMMFHITHSTHATGKTVATTKPPHLEKGSTAHPGPMLTKAKMPSGHQHNFDAMAPVSEEPSPPENVPLSKAELKQIAEVVPTTCSIHGEKVTKWNFADGYLLCVVRLKKSIGTYVLQRDDSGYTYLGGLIENPSSEGIAELGVPLETAKTLVSHFNKI